MLALQLEPLYAAEAKRRMEEGRNQYSPSQNSDEGAHARTDDQLAKLAGTSRDTIRKVKVSIYADQRIGELLRELPTRQGARTDVTSVDTPTKVEAEREAGISHAVSIDLQAMAANPEVVQAVLDKAEAERVDYMRRLLRIEQPRQKKE